MFAAILVHIALQTAPAYHLLDTFDRDISGRGITLVDWEGFIANPAIRVQITPEMIHLPARVVLSSDCDRVVFNLFSEVDAGGCKKTLLIEKPNQPVGFLISILPDRDGKSEQHTLKLTFTDPNEHTFESTVPIEVIDQDRERPLDFRITFDYSQDKTGNFNDPVRRALVQQAADDWTYFFADQEFDQVKAGDEKSWVWEVDGFRDGSAITNTKAYTGFLIYGQGTRNPDKHSGCGASDQGGLQSRKGQPTGLRRSATMSIEETGNYNGNGWQLLETDKDFWRAGNQSHQVADFYSIVHHEMGHGLIFHRVHPAMAGKIRDGKFFDSTIRAYIGRDPTYDEFDHFKDVIDPISHVGSFGNEYGGDMPRKRWVITLFDLLVARSLGYRLRDTSPFQTIKVTGPKEVTVQVGEPIALNFQASGGVPTYFYSLDTTSTELKIDSFTGRLSGAFSAAGVWTVLVRAEDNIATNGTGEATLRVVVKAGSISVPAVDQVRFLSAGSGATLPTDKRCQQVSFQACPG